MEQSVTRMSGSGKIARVFLVVLLSLVGLSVVGVGTAYAASQPTVTSMALGSSQTCPGSTTGISGTAAGGNIITVCGSSFGSAGNTTTQVLVNGVALPSTSVEVLSGLRLNATIPAAQSATVPVNIQVVNPSDSIPTSTCTTAACQYTYTWSAAPTVTAISPIFGPIAGGTVVTITGTNLAGPSAVDFGTAAATNVTVTSATSIQATAPSGTVGAVDVTVTTPDGGGAGTTSPTSNADLFNYVTTPAVTSVSTVANPPTGPTGGGTQVQISGTGFGTVTAVTFGSTAASSYLVNSLNSITAISPADTGTVDITVTTSLGTSAKSSADQFTYNSVLTLVPGTASYDSGTSTSTGTTANPTVVQKFNALTLVTGGATIDPTTLTVVDQPASGEVTASGGFLSYTPAQSTPTSTGSGSSTVWTYDTTTTGTQTATIALCNTGFTYPSGLPDDHGLLRPIGVRLLHG